MPDLSVVNARHANRWSRALRILYLTIGGGCVLLVGVAVAAPVYQSVIGPPAGEAAYSLLGAICHQYPSRSFWLTDRPTALCVRCIGGYVGLGVAPLLFARLRSVSAAKRLGLGIGLFAFGLADPIAQIVLNYDSLIVTRFSTGLLGGIGVAVLILVFVPTQEVKHPA